MNILDERLFLGLDRSTVKFVDQAAMNVFKVLHGPSCAMFIRTELRSSSIDKYTTAKFLSMRCLLYYWQESFFAGVVRISSLFRTWILDSSR